MKKVVRHIQPLGMRVLVRVFTEESMAASGLYLPPGAKEKYQEALYGEVLEVARAPDEGLGENVSGVPHGAKVLFRKEAGTRVPWDDALRLLDTKEVLATVEEVSDEDLV